MDPPAVSLASFLEDRGPQLVEQWVERVHTQIDDRGSTRSELRDHIPAVMKELLEAALRGSAARSPHDASTQHVRQRFRIDFVMRQIVAEYALLHTAILDAASAADVSLGLRDTRVLLDFFSSAVADAVRVNQRETSRDTMLERATSADVQNDLVLAGERARTEADDERAAATTAGRALEQQILGIVSHDLRNPLNVIALATSILEASGGLTAAQLATVTQIKRAADRSTARVRDLLDFTQARLGGGIPIETCPVELHTVVTRIVEEVTAAPTTREIVYEHEGRDVGVWDPARLGQVVQNLVSNAITYSPPDTPVVLRSRASADAVTLTVHNRGEPIASDQLATIFEPFQRAGALDYTTRSVGLGLYIVRHVVAAHGGTVGVTSTASEGTTFTVSLPLRDRDQAAVTARI